MQSQKNLPQPGVKIQHDQSDVNHALAGVGQFRHDQAKGSFAFGIPKFSFHRDPVQFVLTSAVLRNIRVLLSNYL